MRVKKVAHICVAVRNIEEARKVWEPLLGKTEPDDIFIHEPESIRVFRYSLGGVGLQLMESSIPDGEVAKFIEKNGEGIMLLGLNVGNTRKAIAELESKGYPFIPATGGDKARSFRDGEHAFIFPKALNGVLTQLIDYEWEE